MLWTILKIVKGGPQSNGAYNKAIDKYAQGFTLERCVCVYERFHVELVPPEKEKNFRICYWDRILTGKIPLTCHISCMGVITRSTPVS